MIGAFDLPLKAHADVQVFTGNATANGAQWARYERRPGTTMLQILCIGAGGNGGNGAVGAASTAAGGGGGASGSQTMVTLPAYFLPTTLYVSVGFGGSAVISQVAVYPENNSGVRVAHAYAGNNGGNASGATAGAAGTSGGTTALVNTPLAGAGQFANITGQNGIIGGKTVAGGALTIPTSGLIVTSGTGGGGLPAAATAGTNGGAFTTSALIYRPQIGGIGATAATTPGGNGSNGFNGFQGLKFFYGGSGGGSSHGSATGAGLVGGMGGAGGYGCGGGGGGGALTGSTQGLGGRGGDGIVIITAW